jgi:isomerase DpgB
VVTARTAVAGENAREGGVTTLRIDGATPLTAGTVAAVRAACDRIEDRGDAMVVIRVSGTPRGPWVGDLTVGLVSRWERELRRLECLPATSVAVAEGDCGGPALDALLATDYRIAAGPIRLVLPMADAAVWPGMALYRLTQQSSSPAAVRRAILFGTPVDLDTALASQLIDEVTDDVPAALSAAAGLAARISGPDLAVRRRLMFEAATAGFEEALGVHLAACDRLLRGLGAGAGS